MWICTEDDCFDGVECCWANTGMRAVAGVYIAVCSFQSPGPWSFSLFSGGFLLRRRVPCTTLLGHDYGGERGVGNDPVLETVCV